MNLGFKSLGEGSVFHEPLVILRPEVISVGKYCRIDSFVKIEGGQGITIGDYVHISSFSHVGGGGGSVIIEDHAGLASGAKIISGTTRLDALSMSAASPLEEQLIVRKTTILRKRALICTNAVVCPGVTIGEHAVLAAGSVAVRDIPAFEVWGGVPAKKIGESVCKSP